MAGFIESLSKEHLRQWLESKRGWELHAEVPISSGRIDLAGVSPSGDYVGIELKANVPEYPSNYYGQLSKYLASGCFDKVYFASHDAEKFQTRLDAMDVSFADLRTAARHLNGGIEAGLYTEQDVLDRMEKEFSSDFLYNTDAYLNGFKEWGQPWDFVACRLGAKTAYEPVDLSRGMELIRYSQPPRDIGIIEVPIGGVSHVDKMSGLSPTDKQITSPRSALGLDEAEPITILREGNRLPRSTDPEWPQSRTREPFIKHHVWRKFTGLPEAFIPNTTDSSKVTRPIDILSFQGGVDPVNICNQEEGEIIGIEVKGASYDKTRAAQQLREYATCGGLSRLYIAVPDSSRERTQILLRQEQLSDLVGIVIVHTDGSAELISEAPKLDLRYDSYLRSGNVFRVGYDEMSLPTDVSPNSVFTNNE